jgi:hypothetical protein
MPAPALRRPRTAHHRLRLPPDQGAGPPSDVRLPDRDAGRDATAVPYEVLKFAPKKMRRDGVAMDQPGDAIVGMLQDAGRQLRAAEDRIDELETEIARVQDRAVRAETWLQLVGREIEQKLIEPATAARSKIDDLAP